MIQHIAVLLRVMRVNKSKYIIAWGVSLPSFGRHWGVPRESASLVNMLVIEVKIAVKLS